MALRRQPGDNVEPCCARSRTPSLVAWLPSQAHAAASSRPPPQAEASPLLALLSSVRQILDRHSPSVPPLVKAEGGQFSVSSGGHFLTSPDTAKLPACVVAMEACCGAHH